MNETEEARPAGRDEASSTQLGEPERPGPRERGPGDAEKPDLDERERRFDTRRKPAGPPLQEPGEGRPRTRGEDEPPVDPPDPEEA